MKITQIETDTALFLHGVGTMPKTLVVGSKTKYPDLKLDVVEPGVGVKVTIGRRSAIVPWSEIKIAVCEE